MDYTYLLKFVIVGDVAVGKSCLMLQFIEGKFRNNHDLTIGVEFGTKTVDHNGRFIKLQIWDTAGQESFRSITRSYYRSAAGAILVYDITRRESFQSVEKWLEELRSNLLPHVEIILVGNKSDNSEKRKVSFEEGKKFADENGLHFVEISAKDSKAVEDIFMKITLDILEKIRSGKIDITKENSGVKLGSETGGFHALSQEGPRNKTQNAQILKCSSC